MSAWRLWQFVTYMFMHDTSSLGSGFTHIFFNMFSLWMFGRILEPVMGRTRYLTYYVVCGLGAALVQELVWQFTWPAVAAGMFSYGGVAGITTAQLSNLLSRSDLEQMMSLPPLAMKSFRAAISSSV